MNTSETQTIERWMMQEIGWLILAITFAVGVLACLPCLWQRYRHDKAVFAEWKRRRAREERKRLPSEGQGYE